MADVVIVTSSYGGFDPVWPQTEQDIEVDWVYVTDADLDAAAPWQVDHRPTDLSPRMAAKLPKIKPPAGYRYAIWINGSYQLKSPEFARMAIDHLHDGLSLMKHPYRSCIYEEAQASRVLPKYDGQPIDEQVECYRSEGHPEHYGLWECGAIAWDMEHDTRRDFARLWLKEIKRWTIQDQLSFPVVCRRLGITPGIFPADSLLNNPWWTIHSHHE